MKTLLLTFLIVLTAASNGPCMDTIANGTCGTFLHIDEDVFSDFTFERAEVNCNTNHALIASRINVSFSPKTPEKDPKSVKITPRDLQGNVIRGVKVIDDGLFKEGTLDVRRVHILSQEPVYNLSITQ